MGPLAASSEALAKVVNGTDLNRELRRFSYINFRGLRECSADETFVHMGFPKQSELETDASFIDEFWDMSLDVFAKSGLRPQFSNRLTRDTCAGAAQQRVDYGVFGRGNIAASRHCLMSLPARRAKPRAWCNPP